VSRLESTRKRASRNSQPFAQHGAKLRIVKDRPTLVNWRQTLISPRADITANGQLTMAEPKQASLDKMWKYVNGFAAKSGTTMHPNRAVTESVVKGLAMHVDELGKPLCPCNFYKDKAAEAKRRRWICACDEMQMYKYCHCLLFVREDGMPITEYLPEGHEGREIYGIVTDPTPGKGRALKHKAAAAPIPTDETPASSSPTL
jgi:ferredoxin-thioredoxin reductase catalytic chain